MERVRSTKRTATNADRVYISLMFIPPSLLIPDWFLHPAHSTWSFTTSEGGEFDATIVAAAKGSYYVQDSRDADAIQHELLYVGLGVTVSKGPIPFGIGGSFSTPDMYSAGVGNIYMKPSKGSIELSDFGGSGFIVSGSIGLPPNKQIPGIPPPPAGNGYGAQIIFFGAPPLLTVAIGLMISKQYVAPGIGATLLPCIFTVDP